MNPFLRSIGIIAKKVITKNLNFDFMYWTFKRHLIFKREQILCTVSLTWCIDVNKFNEKQVNINQCTLHKTIVNMITVQSVWCEHRIRRQTLHQQWNRSCACKGTSRFIHIVLKASTKIMQIENKLHKYFEKQKSQKSIHNFFYVW